jgi:probable LLM family oxidoreductase
LELGVYSFGDTSIDPATGKMFSPDRSIKLLLERIKLADEVGLDYFGVGEHHRPDFPVSSPAIVLAAAASITSQIRLGSSVTVLSTEDPVRVFQQFAEIDLISGGRAEITVGRGSFIESFPLFGENLADYNELFEEKLGLLMQLNGENPITWHGRFRAPLNEAHVWPRPLAGELPIWVGTGGTAESSARAGRLGLDAIYAIIGGYPARFSSLVDYYRDSARAAGHDPRKMRVGVAGFGLVGDNAKEAKEVMYPAWMHTMRQIAAERGFAAPNRQAWEAQANGAGAFLVGDASEVAERILTLKEVLGHDRHILQMDGGFLDHLTVMKSIELLGTKVKPILAAHA